MGKQCPNCGKELMEWWNIIKLWHDDLLTIRV